MPHGYGFRLPKRSDVVVQVHYHRDGRVEHDHLQIGLYFAKKTVGMKAFKSGVIAGRFFAIPANDANFKVYGSTTVTDTTACCTTSCRTCTCSARRSKSR